MSNQTVTNTLLMVRPIAFGRNEETAVNNHYQKTLALSADEIQQRAQKEFDAFVDTLRNEGVEVIVIEDTLNPLTPDSIFPNNWISFHESGEVWLYPMYAPNRRKERRQDVIDSLKKLRHIEKVHSLEDWEKENKFLEGTGSMIFDRPGNIAYAAISERTHPDVLKEFEEKSGMEIVAFHAYQSVGDERKLIYHTNVMMFVGEKVAVICADSIDDENERKFVLDKLETSGKEVILISETQTECFAGNMLQVKSSIGENKVVMSKAAFNSLNNEQKDRLSRHGKLVYSDLHTIETLGGGSARCMMAEVFLPSKK